MKKNIIFIVFFAIAITSCKTTQKVITFEEILYPNGQKPILKNVDESTLRLFNYYFMEAIRLKTMGEYQKSAMYYQEAIRNNPSCATCYYELSNLYYYTGDLRNAEETAFRAVQLDPENEWFILYLSRIFLQNNKAPLALKTARYLVDLKPENFDYLYNLSQMEVHTKQYSDAIATLNKIEKIIGKNEYLSLQKHAIYLEANDYKNAKNEINKLIKKYPTNYEYRVYLGDYYAQRNNLKAAYEEYKKVLDLDPSNGPVNFSLASYYLTLNDSANFKKAVIKGFESPHIDLENKIQRLLPFLMNLNDPQNPIKNKDFEDIFEKMKITHKDEVNVYVLYGNYLNHNNQRAKAVSEFETAILIDEKLEEVWNDFLFLALSEYENDKFLEKCEIAVKLFDQNPIIHFLTAIAYSQIKDYEKAIEHLNFVLIHNKNNDRLKEQAHAMLGDFYYKVGEREKSFYNYEEALKIDANSIIVLNNYAYYLSLEGMNLDKAERMISKVIEFEPFNPTYLDTYAWVLFKRGRYFEAVFIMEQALNYSKEISGVLYEHYGDILYKNGDVQKAVENWKKAAETNDEDLSDKLAEKIEKESYVE